MVGEGSASRVLSAMARSLDLIWRDWRVLRRGQTGPDFQRATLWKTVWGVLRKIKVELPYDSAILFLGIYLKQQKPYLKKI